MRIGLFTDVYLPCISGMVVAVDNLKKALERRGHKVFVITTNSDFRKRRFVREGDVIKIPGVPSFIYDYNFTVVYPFKAERIIEKLNLDIIHSHTELTIGKLGKRMARKLGIPFIQTLHTMYEEEVDYVTKGHFRSLSKRVVCKYLSSFYNKNVDEVIVPSRKVFNKLKCEYKIATNINIIPNGIELDRFLNYDVDKVLNLKKKYGINDDDFVMLFVGRLGYEKNIDFLIEAHKRVVCKHKNAKLLIVGDGPDYDLLLELVSELSLEENVIFTGKVCYDEIHNYYHLADVLVTASKCESQGLTLIEALASEVLVCAIKTDVFLPVVKPFYNGMLFKNKLDYVFIMHNLINHPKRLWKMKKNTVSSVLDYSLDVYAERILNVYLKALSDKNINSNKDCS